VAGPLTALNHIGQHANMLEEKAYWLLRWTEIVVFSLMVWPWPSPVLITPKMAKLTWLERLG